MSLEILNCEFDCGGVDGDTQLRELSAGKQRTGRTGSCHASVDGRGLEAAAEVQGSRFNSGPQSPSDDFGLMHCLPLVIAAGLAFYAVVAALVLL